MLASPYMTRSVAIAAGKRISVPVGAKVSGVAGSVTNSSYAPLSKPPSCGRPMPRWSVLGDPKAIALLKAGEFFVIARTQVPKSRVSGSSKASVELRSFVLLKKPAQVESSDMLPPSEINDAEGSTIAGHVVGMASPSRFE